MTPRPPVLNRSQVVGYVPKESFVIAEVEVMTLAATMAGFFQGTGLQVDLNAADIGLGTVSLWLTLADAKALVAAMETKVRQVAAWREVTP